MARASYKHKSGFGNMFIEDLMNFIVKHISFNVSSENEAIFIKLF
jgi:hypothetical protein